MIRSFNHFCYAAAFTSWANKGKIICGFFCLFFCAEIHELHILNLYTSSMNLKVP